MKKNAFLILLFSFILVSCNEEYKNLEDGIYADILTSKGNIILKLEYEKTPITVANFISLAEGKNDFVAKEFKNKPFYDGLKFHRVIEDFMIQGGDPMGDGTGGPGYKFNDEIHPDLTHNKAGILSMANAGPDTNGSQFFITHKEVQKLDGRHTVFGEVIEGMNVVNAIVQDDSIEKITIIRKGSKAKKFDAVKTLKEYYSKEAAIQKENEKKAAAAKETKSKEIEELIASGTKTKSGLLYKYINKGEGKKPANGTEVYVHYAGFLETGELFDTSFEAIANQHGKLDPNKAAAKAYLPFPFPYGNKQGLIPGFTEALDMMNFGDRILVFIPSSLGYGSQGAGNVIPPNTNIVFEIELLETMPNQ